MIKFSYNVRPTVPIAVAMSAGPFVYVEAGNATSVGGQVKGFVGLAGVEAKAGFSAGEEVRVDKVSLALKFVSDRVAVVVDTASTEIAVALSVWANPKTVSVSGTAAAGNMMGTEAKPARVVRVAV